MLLFGCHILSLLNQLLESLLELHLLLLHEILSLGLRLLWWHRLLLSLYPLLLLLFLLLFLFLLQLFFLGIIPPYAGKGLQLLLDGLVLLLLEFGLLLLILSVFDLLLGLILLLDLLQLDQLVLHQRVSLLPHILLAHAHILLLPLVVLSLLLRVVPHLPWSPVQTGWEGFQALLGRS